MANILDLYILFMLNIPNCFDSKFSTVLCAYYMHLFIKKKSYLKVWNA
jgi:hypothetical protein